MKTLNFKWAFFALMLCLALLASCARSFESGRGYGCFGTKVAGTGGNGRTVTFK